MSEQVASMKTLGNVILAIHVMGVLIATGLAWWAIPTVVLSGPILGSSGMAIAYVSFRGRRPVGFYYGLAAPSMTVFCLCVISGMHWSPDEAHLPIGTLLGLFAPCCVLLGIGAVRELSRSMPLKHRIPVQFGIASLLWTMLFVSVFFSCVRIQSQTGMAVVGFVGYAIFTWRVVRNYLGKEAEFAGEHATLVAPRVADDSGNPIHSRQTIENDSKDQRECHDSL